MTWCFFFRSASEGHPLKVTIPVTNCNLAYLEHAQAITTITVVGGQRKGVSIKLTSPKGTTSVLLPYRRMDNHFDGFHQWPFMTVHSWGEDPKGTWTFTIETKSTGAKLDALQLVLYGTTQVPAAVQRIPDKCHTECSGGCANAGARYCDSCKSMRMTSTLECVSSCPPETFTRYHMCDNCPALCAECQSEASCLECKSGAVTLENGLCAVACPRLTYLASNGSCRPCHHSCLSCTGPHGNNCTDCPRQFILQGGECVVRSSCPNGQYFDQRRTECRFCHRSCAECSGKGDDDCTECPSGFSLDKGHCVVDSRNLRCATGQYYDDGSSNCVTCPNGCSDCSDELMCTNCTEGHYLETHRVGESSEEKTVCVARCSRGFFADESLQRCHPCPPYCSMCTSLHDCTSCTPNSTQPVDGLCPPPCHDGQYYDQSAKQCLSCAENCQRCVKREQCLRCAPKFYSTSNGQCVTVCPSHTITNEDAKICEQAACDLTCLTCFGTEPNQCMSCPQGAILHDNSCIQDCPSHTFFNGSGCQHCHASCASCAGPAEDNCDSCSPGDILDHFRCIPSCPPGSFLSQREKECIACPLHCLNCSNTTKCKVCEEGYLLLPTNQSCVSHCPKGFLHTSASCQPCLDHCDVCFSLDTCTKCRSGYVYYPPEKSCLEHCPAGYYALNGRCAECRTPCSSCTGPSQCTVCQTGMAMTPTTHTCHPCCNADSKSNQPCCDCDANEEECVWRKGFHLPISTSPTDNPHSPHSPLPYVILVVTMVIIVVVAVVGLLMLLVRYRNNSRRYNALPTLPKDELEIVGDSGSEAEIYTAHT